MTLPKNATKSLNEMIDACGDVEEKADKFSSRFPRKSEWDKPERYDTLMYYEVRSEVAEAYEAGARAVFDVLGPALKRACIALEVLGDSDSALFAKAELGMIRAILEKAVGE